VSDRTARQTLTRAELLRQKREEQPLRVPVMPAKKIDLEEEKPQVVNPFGNNTPLVTQQPIKRAAVMSTHSYPYSTPLRESVSTPARRKVYHVASNGVETRMPAMPAIHFSWQWVSGFMTVVLTTAIFLMLYLPVFDVNRIVVNGLQRVSLEDVQAIVQKNTSSIFTIDTNKLLSAMGLAFPELTDISLSVDLTGAITMNVSERTPILMWFAGDYSYWIDDQGVVMTPRGDPGPLKTIQSECGMPIVHQLPVAHNVIDFVNIVLSRKQNPPTPEDVITYINPDILKAALELGAQKPDSSSLVYDAVSGLGWKDGRGWKVYFGTNLDDLQFKEVEYQTILNYLTAQGQTPTVISVEHVDAPYYKTK
jgi:hypothetical protein